MALIQTTAELTLLLADARAAYHALSIGQAPRVFVDQNGERIEYQATNRNLLAAYIQELERKLGIAAVSGPMGVWMGP